MDSLPVEIVQRVYHHIGNDADIRSFMTTSKRYRAVWLDYPPSWKHRRLCFRGSVDDDMIHRLRTGQVRCMAGGKIFLDRPSGPPRTFEKLGEATVVITDEVSWSAPPPTTSPRALGFHGSCWSPDLGIFVVHQQGSTCISRDGVEWEHHHGQSPDTGRIYDVAWSPELGVFCTVSQSGILLSRDARVWTKVDTAICTAVCWCSTFFCAIDDRDRVGTSRDGISWAFHDLVGDGRALCWSPQLEAICVVSYCNFVCTSFDKGITWTRHDVDIRDQNIHWVSVCWSEEFGIFVALGLEGSIMISTKDGRRWTLTRDSVLGEEWRWSKIRWAPEINLFCAIAEDGSTTMTSQDAFTWTTSQQGEFGNISSRSVHIHWIPTWGQFVSTSHDVLLSFRN